MIAWRILLLAIGHATRRIGLTAAAVLASLVAAGGLTYIVGDATNQNTQLLQQLRTPLARSILVRSTSTTDPASFLAARDVRTLASLPGVEHAIGLTPVRSAANAAIPGADNPIGFFEIDTLTGPPPFALTAGRLPHTGEALLSIPGAQRLRASIPLATGILVDQHVLGVVGTYTTPDNGRLTDLLSASALTIAPPDTSSYALVALVVREPSDIATVVHALPVIFSDRLPTDYNVEYDPRLADIQATVASAGRRSIRSTALALTAIGAAIQAVVTAINALTQRREIARRRALGATRSQVLGTLVTESAILSTIGAALGSLIAAIVLASRHADLTIALPVAAATFVAITATFAAIPGGLFGAFQDPATILRVP
jgi:putative ABC transport system permease protein